MDITIFEDFITLSELLNFSAASNELHITQPAISRRINSLEKNFDVTLFNRSTRSVSLTKAGKALVPEAKKIIDAYYGAIERAELVKKSDDTLRIGGHLRYMNIRPQVAATEMLLNIKFPWVEVYTDDLGVQDYRHWLLKTTGHGKFDLMISPKLPQIIDSRFAYIDLFEIPLSVWVNKNSPVASESNVSFKDLKGLTYRPLNWGSRNDWDAFISTTFFHHKIIPQVGKPVGMTIALDENDYTLVLAERNDPYPSLNAIKLEENVNCTISICYLKGSKHTAAKQFVSTLASFYTSEAEDTQVPPL